VDDRKQKDNKKYLCKELVSELKEIRANESSKGFKYQLVNELDQIEK